MKDQSSMDQIIESLNSAKTDGKGCVLLIGSGCSVKAGIPDSAGLVKVIKDEFPKIYEKADNKDYHSLMAQLGGEEKTRLVAKYFSNAKINWAHIASALLMQNNYVERILTTNFDNLALKACHLAGEWPAIYDCAASKIHGNGCLPGKSILHLHGQHPGQANLDSQEGFEALYESLEPVFQDAEDRPWIVVGYSGENDPVLKHLAKVESFKSKLFWIGNKKSEPPKEVREQLLDQKKGAFYFAEMDADSFLVSLAQKLGIFPPKLISHPYSRLKEMVDSITPFVLPGQNDEIDVTRALRDEMQTSVEEYENFDPKTITEDAGGDQNSLNRQLKHSILSAQRHLMSGNPERTLVYHELYERSKSPQLAELLFGAYIMQGNSLRELSAKKGEKASPGLLQQAAEKYEAACEIKPDKGEALFHLGTMLMDRAKQEKDKNGVELFEQAANKFQAAVKVNPDWYQAYQAWGTAVFEQAQLCHGKKAEPLFAQAIKIFQAALGIREDLPEALYGLGKAMVQQARWQKGGDAVQLFAQAMKKFQAALSYQANHYQALTSWAHVLTKLAENMDREEADNLLTEAQEKFKAAIKVNPEHHQAYLGWGRALWKRGTIWEGKHADSIYGQAMEKFQAALSRKTNLPEALFGWGKVLYTMGKQKTGAEASKLLGDAVEKFRATLEIQPENYDVLHFWGKSLLHLGDHLKGQEAEKSYDQAAEKFQQVLALKPKHSNALSDWGKVFLHLAMVRPGQEKALLNLATEKFQTALESRPDNAEALIHWGTALFQLAQSKEYTEAEPLYKMAEEKYQEALDIQPNHPKAFNNWGWILLQKAKSVAGRDKAKDSLFKQAADKFKSAVELDSEMHEAMLNWGSTLMEQAKTKRGIEVHPFLANAKRKLQQAEDMEPGSGSYHLARLMALLANETGCREWLEKCKELGTLPEQKVWRNEPDFTHVRNSKWFTNLIPVEPIKKQQEKEKKKVEGAKEDKEDIEGATIEFK